MTYPERFSRTTGLIILHPLLVTFILLSSYPIIYNIPTPFWFIILASFILSILFILVQNWFSEQTLLYIVFFADIPLIASMIHYTGGLYSMFPLLYVLLIILSALYLSRKGAYIISLCAVAFFLGLLVFEANMLMYPIRFVIYRFYIFALLFLFTAILSGTLSERYQVGTEEIRRLRLTTEEIIKNIPSGIITIDGAGSIIYTNITDEPTRNRVHIHIVDFLKLPDRASLIELKIGKRYYVLSCARFYNSKAALGILQDVTDLRKLQEASRISRQTKLLAELGGSLAHEIRNPLAAIRGALEVIQDSVKRADITPFVNMAVKESMRLNEIVTDFLKFAQFAPIKLNRLRVSEVVNEALLETMHKANQKNIEIRRKDNDFFVLADMNKLKSVFINILNNSFEVSEDRQRIEIESYLRKHDGCVKIRDHGRGIPKRDITKIFAPFYTTKKGGTGLGLAIARNIIEAHNGHIEVKSQVGEGATFTVVLPLA